MPNYYFFFVDLPHREVQSVTDIDKIITTIAMTSIETQGGQHTGRMISIGRTIPDLIPTITLMIICLNNKVHLTPIQEDPLSRQ